MTFARRTLHTPPLRAWLAGALAALCWMVATAPEAGAQARLKDIAEFEGVRGNDLLGIGLVVGLNGTGDGMDDIPFAEEGLTSTLERLGVNVRGEDFEAENTAVVIVTATLPPFARAGAKIDVTVSAVGNATSLLGGTLILTPLSAADGELYAVAQGPILAGGFVAAGAAAEETTGVPTSGTVPNGARVEREVAFSLNQQQTMRIALREPDFTTAIRVEEAVNRALGRDVALMTDPGTVELNLRAAHARSLAHLMAAIENVRVMPAQKARVVVDQRSGTIVLGADVKVSQVAVSQGNLTIRVNEFTQVSQPNPFSETGDTVSAPRTDIAVEQGGDNQIGVVNANVTLADLVSGLNALGVGPRGMIDILKTIKTAGALHAELVIQ